MVAASSLNGANFPSCDRRDQAPPCGDSGGRRPDEARRFAGPCVAAQPKLRGKLTALFAWTRNLRLYRFTQLLMTLVLPWIVTMSLGGFRNSSAVIIWAALCPVVSLLVEDLRQTLL